MRPLLLCKAKGERSLGEEGINTII
ncbi:hypothetical protein HYALB_00013781 [Hymenoscyphus albidus]|uniref:Uncharacterized protein n=1 Tax=Hymenoscyphus albidus TaxID=595503 RepID=A0A9N9QC16_9HELO|nr:hypothetical protein HYALB_00013781 [Hymenoscyphus albidus]